MKIRIIYILTFLLISLSAFPQYLVNQNQMNIHAGFLVIKGDYVNQGSGNIILDGTIQLTGNWTNNVAYPVMSAPNGTGTTIFNGVSLQTIGGSSTDSLSFEGITINSGASVQVQAGIGITAYGPCNFSTPLILKSTTTAYRPKMATFINKGSVTGNISMEFSYTSTGSITSGASHGQFFSSPISNATNAVLGPWNFNTNRIYKWDIVNKYTPDTAGSPLPFTIMRGYLYRSSSTGVFAFTGPPNANVSYTISGFTRPAPTDGYFLAGNPYPAVIDWQTIPAINRPTIDNTFYVRCANISGSMFVDTWNGALSQGTSLSGAPIDGKIAPMQGFWVKITTPGQLGSLTIARSNIGHNWGLAPFLKSGSISSNEVFRLGIYSGNSKDEIILALADSARDDLDSWDSQKLFQGDPARPEIYTFSPEGNKLVIQSVKPVTQEKLFPIGFNNGTAGNYQFKADMSQVTGNYYYYLEDKKLNIIQDLQSNPEYSFSSDPVTDTLGSRFVLHVNITPTFKSGKVADGINKSGPQESRIYSFGKDVYLDNCETHAQVTIYNLLGTEVYNSTTNSDQEVISVSAPKGIYLVKLETGNTWKIQKVLLK